MIDHKIRQDMFHSIESSDDWFDKSKCVYRPDSDDIVSDVRDYFSIQVDNLIYPSKSYAVGIIYSQLIEQYFDVPFMESLKDPNLLHNNDKYFVCYKEESSIIYDQILNNLDTEYDEYVFNCDLLQVKTTIDYFKKEFYLFDNPYFHNPY